MSTTKLPRAVPVSEASNYTDDITFDTLGAPVGFDQDQLLVDLRGFNYIRVAAGLGIVSVVTRDALMENAQPIITGVNSQGTATMGMTVLPKKKPLSEGTIHYKQGKGASFMRPDVSIVLDNGAIESRIQDKEGGNVFDAVQRAEQLNKAVRRGLHHANKLANFGVGDCLLSSVMYGYSISVNGFPSPNQAYIGALGNIIFTALNLKRYSQTPGGAQQALKQSRFSLFIGVAPDRYLVASSLLARARLLKPIDA